MKLSVVGMGYVGCVSAACFAEVGHEVIGLDVSDLKVEMINNGKSPIIEPGIDEMIATAVSGAKLRATTSTDEAINESEISLVCVGTPGKHNGSLDLTYVIRACRDIGKALKTKLGYHVVVVRSTVLPGTVEESIIPILEEHSGKRAGRDFGVALNPEFLREGSSIRDFNNAPFTLIGADDEDVITSIKRLYSDFEAPFVVMGLKEAGMIKYASNSFHALKVAFANEIGNLCARLGADSHQVMEVFCRDTSLNLSSAYLKPGFAFGGSCLPKDLRAINYKARELDVEVPLLSSILPSNRLQIERAVDMVLETGKKDIGVLGLSFKSGTDDLRESPMVTLVETLIGKGLNLAIYDRDVHLARLVGANKSYIENGIPHISSLMRPDIRDVLSHAQVVILGKRDEEFRKLTQNLNSGRVVIDLVGLLGSHVEHKSHMQAG